MEAKMNELVVGMYMTVMGWKQNLIEAASKKRPGIETFVAVMALCIIVLVIAVVFRDGIKAWFANLMQDFEGSTDNLFS